MISARIRMLTLGMVASLAACSGAAPSSLPPGGTSLAPSAIAGRTALKPSRLRASPVYSSDCTTASPAPTPTPSTVTTGSSSSTTVSGTCSHIQLASVSYGPSTPANEVSGYHPADLQSAYNLPSQTAGAGQTIGIVIGGDDPSAASDLAVYRGTFGLGACTTQNGCFRQISVKNVPPADATWAAEASIDVEMASAVCPKCHVLLVEAKSSADKDLADAVSAAVSNGATVVTNSYIIPEYNKLNDDDWYHPGVPIVAASGDQGYQTVPNWPAASSHVIAVGGTTLLPSGGARGWSETAWSRSGSGCSGIAGKPVWQTDRGCANRAVADVAAVADPATPVAVYDTYQNSGWIQMGGTSVAAPIVAGAYALAGNGSSLTGAASIYAHPAALNTVSGGMNGSCSALYLCVAGAGYSGPAGLGSPNGVNAF